MDSKWIIIDGAKKYEYNLSHWIYSAAELKEMLKKTGFNSVKIYGSFDGSPYDHNAQRLVAVGNKN